VTVTTTDNMSLEEMDRLYVMHPLTNLKEHASGKTRPQIITGGSGIRIRDQDGRELIDGFAALYCVNIGYGRPEIAEAIYAQAKQMAYFHSYRGTSSEPLIRLSHRVIKLAPEHMVRVFYGLSGSDANETQVKIVWYYNNVLGRPKKKKIISRERGYHGATVMAGSLTGIARFHNAFDLPLPGILHTKAPHFFWDAAPGESERDYSRRLARELEAMIEREGADTVAAFIAEPVIGTGGIVPPPEGYWEEIQRVLARHDVLLIADEVVCGFGRCGTPFGSQLYAIKPDLMTIAKGLTSAYVPLSGAIVGDRIWEVLEQGSEKFGPFTHGYTYSGHAIAAAAALANLDVIEREDLIGNARRTGAYLQRRLREAFGGHPLVGEVRGVGLLAALEFVADRGAKTRFDAKLAVGQRIAAACLERGLIVRAMPVGESIGLSPPLVTTRSDVDQIVDILAASSRSVFDALAREGGLTATAAG
jgi:L-2,4-diaminobutyrate transaminase